MAEKVNDQRARAAVYCVASVGVLDDGLVGWLEFGGGSEAEEERAASRVRDSEDGLEVVVVQRRADGTVNFLDDARSEHAGDGVVPFHGPPEDRLARALAATTVRLPVQLTNDASFDETLDALERDVHEGWQESRWLRGLLALHLDDDWCAQLAGHELRYDIDSGLVVTRVES